MKKSFRILALVMALMTALGAASFASADMPTNYVGVTTVEDTDFFYPVSYTHLTLPTTSRV